MSKDLENVDVNDLVADVPLEELPEMLPLRRSGKKDGRGGESEKKYLRLEDKLVASLPAAALLAAHERLMDIFARGKKRGKLDSGELNEIMEELNLDARQCELVFDSLEPLGVVAVSDDELLSELADDLEPPLEEIADIEEEELVDPNTLVDNFSIDDPVRMYLKEIGKVPLLNPEEEIDLAQRMASGDEIAKQKLAEANLRLVVSIA